MKKIIISLAVFASVAIYAFSQPHGKQPMDPSEMVTRIVKELSEKITLSSETQESLKTIFYDFHTEMHKSMESGTRPDITKLETDRDKKVKALLTDEQYKVYQKVMEEHKPGKGGPGRRESGDRPPMERVQGGCC